MRSHGALALVATLALIGASASAQPPPPAPVMSPSRQEVIEILGRPSSIDHCLPLTLGTGAPTAILRREGSDWVIRHLTANRAEQEAARRAALARGDSWMPESTWRFLRPGRVLRQASSRAELHATIERMTDWTALHLGAERPPGPSRAEQFCSNDP